MKTEGRGPRGVEQERARTGVARCACRGLLGFTTDQLGRALESCASCGYHGRVRPVAVLLPPTPPRVRRPPHPRNANTFRCGHSKADENSYTNKEGFKVCRTCSRERVRAFRASMRRAS
jgi:hypothetical protein